MKFSRCQVLCATTAASASGVTREVTAQNQPNDLSSKIISIFKELPGYKGLYITTGNSAVTNGDGVPVFPNF